MFFVRSPSPQAALFAAALGLSGLASTWPTLAQDLNPFGSSPDNAKRYDDCMAIARKEPMRALPVAEKWLGDGGGMGARHCQAIALFEAGRPEQAATQFESIARDLKKERPDLRADLWSQAGQAWSEAGQLDKAAAAQGNALDLRPDDPELWVDRGLSYATLREWPRAISDFSRALALHPNDVEVLVLRAAAWRNAGNAARAVEDAQLALKAAPDNTAALLERGFSLLARGDAAAARADFTKVVSLVPPSSDAAKRAEAGLQAVVPGEKTVPASSRPAGSGDKR